MAFFKRKKANGDYVNDFFSASFTSNNQNFTVTEEQALQIPAFKACLNLITNTIAELPINLMQHDGENVTILNNDKRVQLLNNPNIIDTASTLKAQLVKDLLLYGKAYLYNNSNELHVLKANFMNEEYFSNDGFTIGDIQYIYNFDGSHKLLKENVIRFDSGTKGILSNTEVLETAINNQTYSKNVLKNGAMPIGILKAASRLTEKAIDSLRTSFENIYSGNQKVGKTLILENGLEYQPLSYNPEQLQLNETSKSLTSQICMLFNVSESLINDTSNKYNSLSTANTSFLQQTIQPILVTIQEQLNKSFLKPSEQGLFFMFDTSQILKATETERIDATLKLFKDGVISFNESRKRLDMTVIDDKKDYYKLNIGQALRDKATGEVLNINTQTTNTQGEQKNGTPQSK
ncbi:phage portal protein [Rummeliibacillus pycnus]|uniref:phage portal protein n=1 Tax=Rummeliibacillus pycnus TaxID=101070 RepID=UPI000C9CFFAD|nr:phage portal protein [Rummeliibacillus pycnus]